jgi:hypothetical protein
MIEHPDALLRSGTPRRSLVLLPINGDPCALPISGDSSASSTPAARTRVGAS